MSRELDFDWSFCQKKIRIAFYMQPPFIIVDPSKCKPDPNDASAARLCPSEAFGDKPNDDNNQQPMFDGERLVLAQEPACITFSPHSCFNFEDVLVFSVFSLSHTQARAPPSLPPPLTGLLRSPALW